MTLADHLPEPPQEKGPKLNIDAGPDGGEFSGFVVPNPLAPDEYESAFEKVYKLAGLNPEDYRIVDDTIRFSVWQTSARDKNTGNRDLITLYSYRARFARISAMDVRTEQVVQELAERFRKRKASAATGNRRIPGTGLGPECSYTVGFSDWQLGKNATREGDPGETGVEQTVNRVERAIEASKVRIKNLRRIGRNVTGVALLHMGDPTENVADSYEQQTFTIELNLTQQIELALRLMVRASEELLPLAEKRDALFVLCNHGQMARRGTKVSVTNDADNVQNFLAGMLRDWIVGPKMPEVNWHVPGEKMLTTATIAGVPIAAAHGHKITGREDQWLLRQTTYLTAARDHTPRVWVTAHRHSQDTLDLGSVVRIQCATADGGSKHFTDGSGIYATPGTTSFLLGNHAEWGYSDLELL